MQACRVTVTTTVDGRETTVSRTGECSFANPAVLRYTEDNAAVTVEWNGATALVTRTGDYGLSLRLTEGETTEGKLCLGGAEGAVETQTERVRWTVTDSSLLASLQYALIFGKERQEMRLRITARAK